MRVRAGRRVERAAGIAVLRVLDLDDVGAEPGERLGAGGAGLELGEVENAHAGQAIPTVHRRFLRFAARLGGAGGVCPSPEPLGAGRCAGAACGHMVVVLAWIGNAP